MVAMDDPEILNDPAALSQIPAIPVENTIAYVNQAALVMVQHMNRFSAAAEEKLYHISTSITRLETELAIIEGKLSSIPGLDAVLPAETNQVGKPDSSQPTAASNTSVPPSSETTPTLQPRPIIPPVSPPPEVGVVVETAQSKLEDMVKSTTPTMLTVQNDPLYSKYFKMLNVGVPLQAVKLKMKSEGLNSNILDAPNTPSQSSPRVPFAKKKNSDSESSALSSEDE